MRESLKRVDDESGFKLEVQFLLPITCEQHAVKGVINHRTKTVKLEFPIHSQDVRQIVDKVNNRHVLQPQELEELFDLLTALNTTVLD
jgi:hypothetical protein